MRGQTSSVSFLACEQTLLGAGEELSNPLSCSQAALYLGLVNKLGKVGESCKKNMFTYFLTLDMCCFPLFLREKDPLLDSTNYQRIPFYQKDQMLHLHSSPELQDLHNLMCWYVFIDVQINIVLVVLH